MIEIRLDMHAGESQHGYLLRLAKAYGLEGSKQLLRGAGLRPRLSFTSEQLGQIAETYDLDVDGWSACNPQPRHPNPLLNQRFQRSERSPVCSECLAEGAWLRLAWDHDLVTACSGHGLVLIDECPGCGEPLVRDRESIADCDQCGYQLANAPKTTASEAECAISALLASAEYPARQLLPGPLGAGPAPSDIGEFLHYLATHIQRAQMADKPRKQARPKSIPEAREQVARIWSVLGRWPDSLTEFVLEKIQTRTGRSVHARMGTWLAIFQREFSSSAYGFFADALDSILATHFDGHLEKYRRTKATDRRAGRSWYSATEVASALNSTPGLVIAAVEEGRIQGRIEPSSGSRYVSIHRDVIDEIKGARIAHMTQSDARKRLGISKLMLQRLVNLGALQELNKDDLPPLVTGAFRQTDIEQFEKRLKSRVRPRTIAPEDLASLQDISLKRGLLEAQVTSVLQDISHGVIRAVAVVPDAVGISALRFDLRDIKSRLHTQADEPMLRVSDLVRYGGWKRDDIKEWIKGELLLVHRERQGQRTIERIPLSSLIAFMTRYAVLSDASKALRTTTNDLLRTLKPARITPAVSDRTGLRPGRGLLVEKLELIRGAQLRRPSLKQLADQLDAPEVTDADDA